MLYDVDLSGKIIDIMKYRIEFERIDIDGDDMDNTGVGLLIDF